MGRHGKRQGPCPGTLARRAARSHRPSTAVVAYPSMSVRHARRCLSRARGPRDDPDHDHVLAPRTRKCRGTLDRPNDRRGPSRVRETCAVQCSAGRTSTPPPQHHQRRNSLAYSPLHRCHNQALRCRPHTRQAAVQEDDDGDDCREHGVCLPSRCTPRASFRLHAPVGDTRRQGALRRRPPKSQPPHQREA